MNKFVLDSIDYITKNFTEVEGTIINILIAAYFIYGLVLAADASKRYKSVLAPVAVFFGWVIGSLIFLPIYLSIRPDQGAKDRVDMQTQKEVLLLGSGLDSCPHCGSVVERFYLYCRNCGEPVIKHCEFCGETLAFHWQHCIKCGKKQNHALISGPNNLQKLLSPPLKKLSNLNTRIKKATQKAKIVASEPTTVIIPEVTPNSANSDSTVAPTSEIKIEPASIENPVTDTITVPLETSTINPETETPLSPSVESETKTPTNDPLVQEPTPSVATEPENNNPDQDVKNAEKIPTESGSTEDNHEHKEI